MTEDTNTDTQEIQGGKKRSGCTVVLICLAAIAATIGTLFAALVIAGSTVPSEPATPTPTKQDWDMVHAIYGCQQYTLTRLAAPSTARFQDANRQMAVMMNSDPGLYRVTMWVESQNAYGVPLRAIVTCTVRVTDKQYAVANWLIQE